MSNEVPVKRRIEFLDFIRGIAAISVAIGHTLEKNFLPAKNFLLTVFNLGAFGVIAFFILSGFVIPFTIEKYNDLKLFWVNRFFRLYPLYWASLIALTVLMVSPFHPKVSEFESHLPISFFANLTMVQKFFKQPHAVGLYWTLELEIIFYAIMSVLFALKLNKKSQWILGLGIACIAALGIIGALMKGHCAFPYRIFWMTCFFFGTATYRFWVGELEMNVYVLLSSLFFAVVGVAIFINFFYFPMEILPDAGLNACATVCAWIGAYALFLGVTFGPKFTVPKVFLWLGKVSYSVYIVQGFVLMLPLNFAPPIAAVVAMILILTISWATQLWIEAPSQELGKRFLAKLRAKSA